jgi:hypothetical protein
MTDILKALFGTFQLNKTEIETLKNQKSINEQIKYLDSLQTGQIKWQREGLTKIVPKSLKLLAISETDLAKNFTFKNIKHSDENQNDEESFHRKFGLRLGKENSVQFEKFEQKLEKFQDEISEIKEDLSIVQQNLNETRRNEPFSR